MLDEFRQRAVLGFLIPTDGSILLEHVEHFCLSLVEHSDIEARISTGLSHTIRYGDSKIPPSLTTNDDRMIISASLPQAMWEMPGLL